MERAARANSRVHGMIVSMTGYGMGSASRGDLAVSVEIRTVNHRFLDMHIRVSREFLFLENVVQKEVRSVLERGRVEVNLSIQNTGPTVFTVNDTLARGYLEAAGKLRDDYGIGGALDIPAMLGLPGMVQNTDPLAGDANGVLSELTHASMQTALESVLRMRRQEGESLRVDMLGNLASIQSGAEQIESLSATASFDALEKLQQRIAQLLPRGGGGIDPQRMAQEAALLAEKSDISEEITRLKSHIEQYRALMDAGEKTGKKLDFLLQELQRETNTILSKSSSLEVANLAIAIKTDIEKLREQVQNVE